MGHWRRWGGLALAVLLLGLGGAAGAGGDYVGTETCGACHEEIVTAFARSSHAVAPGWDAEAACESCHGPGGEHAEAGGDPGKIRNLGELPAREGSQVCLACHQGQEAQFTAKHSIHSLGDVGCTDCHNPHSAAEQLIDRKYVEVCGDCHQAIVAQFQMPRHHPLDENGPACVQCHEPHASRSLRTSTPLYDQTCASCHFEKAGPFIFNHDVVNVDGCASCHEVHGSPNRHLLKHEPQVNLCYQCHSASVTPTWHSAPRFLNEKCTACHTAIHGSNTHPFFLEE